ncbi:tRNA-specific adenosine deaminase [Caloramator mitchellensis]|uniref:tRNA-specific adenosine deaminase n=1 Tax=Caloramator mitchellensis TaxID=908809 RepID=A0A0R3JRW3_CALMK|nr:tRNA adenosine(34) deaminase TadA [Caloramator mitchellensis]KRQ86224.1 tRNA-specific adenosine deaminase [Caloramator mitchellensis]
MSHEYFMKIAIEEAKKSFLLDEVPVGAVIVKDNKIIAKGHNARETLKNALAHAEIIAIDEACRSLGGWRLLDCTMYVTLEPCPMCAGALVNARIKTLVFGAKDYRSGACGSIYNIANDERLNHRIEVIGGILEDECRVLMQYFFRRKRT